MKKFLLLAALSATTFFTSCNSNDDDSNSTKTNNELLVGTWKVKDRGIIENEKEVSDELNTCELQSNTKFTNDNNVTDIYYEKNNKGECEPEESTGKWSLDGNKLTLKYDDDDDSTTVTIQSLTKEELKIIITSSEEGKEYKEYSILTRVN